MKTANRSGTVSRRWFLRSWCMLTGAAGAGLLVACAPAPTPTPKPAAPTVAPQPATPSAAPTVAPQPAKPTAAPAVIAPTPAAKPAVSTAGPSAAQPTAAPKPVVIPGLLRPPEPNPKRGGTLRIAGPFTVPHFDLHQGAWALVMIHMYNGLVRKNLADGLRTIVPDLAERWEISPDGKVYTFFLRDGVKWHDGSPFTSEDVQATFTRIISPPQGITSVLKDQISVVEKVEAVDRLTVRFLLKQPWPPLLEVLTGGINVFLGFVIYPKKALAENNYDLRKVIAPGTGAFKLKEHRVAEKWVLERNPSYWDPELPYIDTLELIHVPTGADRGTAVLTGRADLAWNATVNVWQEAQKRKDIVSTGQLPSLSAQTAHINNERKPFNDPRVRRAIHLAVSRQNLIKAWQDQEAVSVGRWMPPAGPVSMSPAEIEKLPGYRADKTADIAEAKKLLAEAGHPNGFGPADLLTANIAVAAEIMAPAFQQELKRTLNITTNIRLIERALLAEHYKNGTFDILLETQFSSIIADPTPLWNTYLKCGASSNWSRYCNPEFDKLLDEINKEMDQGKRRQLFSKGMDMLDQDAPFFVTGYIDHAPMWRNYVKGIAMDKRVHTEWGRIETVWLDK